ncbi:MAG: flavodoxin domain-containing protein [Thermoleophilia bacterium]
MQAVVLYESLYGNTREIAEAVAEGLRERGEVVVLDVAGASPDALAGADLVVVGGPTHVHGMSSELSRKGAAEDAAKRAAKAAAEGADAPPAPHVEGPALRTWLDRLGRVEGVRAATFDTRIGKPKLLTGSAEKGIARRLRHHGFEVAAEESFVVEDSAGPLAAGERERARAWGAGLA